MVVAIIMADPVDCWNTRPIKASNIDGDVKNCWTDPYSRVYEECVLRERQNSKGTHLNAWNWNHIKQSWTRGDIHIFE